MKTINRILNVIKMIIVTIIQIVGAVVMMAAIIVFGIAQLIESPKAFKFKLDVAVTSIKKIWSEFRTQRLINKVEKNEKKQETRGTN